MIQTSGGFGVERNIGLLRDPDTMQQNSKLTCDRNDRSVARLLATTQPQAQAPPAQRGVLSPWSEDMVRALDQERSQVDVASLRDAQLRVVAA